MRLESSFIQVRGVGERTEHTLWQHGVTDWRGGVEADVLGGTRRTKVNAFAETAADRLAAGDVRFFAQRLPSRERWRLADTFRDRCTALDIETTGLSARRDVVTTVSLAGPAGTRTLVRGQDLTRERLRAELAEVDLLVTYNGASFDLPFLEDCFELSIETPHLDLMYPCRRLGWRGGLSGVERVLGLERELPDIDGREAVELWHRHVAGQDGALDRLIRYNREDTRVLLPIVDHVVSALDREVFEPHLP